MPKLTPIDPATLIRLFELDGFTRERQKGSHVCMVKPGILRPVVIPVHQHVSVGVILSNLKTAQMSRDRFFELLKQC